MASEILMPALSPTMEEGRLAKWLVKEGDKVAAGDLIAEIETDKAVMEMEATEDGIIGRLLVDEGTEGVKVNTPIALLLEEGEDAASLPDPAPAGGAPAAPPSTKEPAAAAPAAAQPAPAAPPAPAPTPPTGGRIKASPLARRIAAENGLDLARIAGSGPGGRIVKADVEAALAKGPGGQEAPAAATAPPPAVAAPAAPAAPAAAPDIARLYEGRPYTEVALDGMRKTVAARLSEAKQTIPHFYLRRDIRLDALLALRAELNAQLAPRGIKLSVNDFIIKACALALQQVPAANVVWAGDRILQMQASDVAVAVALEGGGLFTPVIRDAEQKSLSQISAEMKDLAERARARRLKPQEYQGGSFAISNLGMFGIDNFDAVINPPQGSILAVGAGVKKPVVGEDGNLGVATVMSVTLSVDHRAIDGAQGAEFLAAIKAGLEAPLAMLA